MVSRAMKEDAMKTLKIASLMVIGFLALGTALWAAQDDGFSMVVEVGGHARPEYTKRGTVYIEALKDRDYSIRITNPLSCRVAVALSVDGLNSIDAKHTTPKKASKWVLGPYESIVISGWQVNGEEARRFYFTGEKDSYGAWLGQTDNLGVIEAAFFRERERQQPVTRRHWPWSGSESPKDEESRSSQNAPSPSSVPPGDRGAGESNESKSSAGLSDDYAATGIGDRYDHDVQWVNLDLESSPSAVVKIRYEFRPQLVKLGLIPRPRPCEPPLTRREEARGFSGNYCPDPHAGDP
jgi:hypothetical protein